MPFWFMLLALASCKLPPMNHPPRPSERPPGPPVDMAPPAERGQPRPQYPYRPSTTKAFDLIHTRLEVRFDWQQERLHGLAELTLRPWFAAQQEVTLDAKGFLIHAVSLSTGGKLTPLQYAYSDLEHLTIPLHRSYAHTDTLVLVIRYTARPAELDSLVSKTAAEDRGLYFVNPRGDIPGKPQEIWTQGESHGSPAWFPTFDTPNQRCTSELYITVADSFLTLSNGLLVDSKAQAGGLRTDHWVMSRPHSPYLFMMAVGKFAVVRDEWRGREVSYYVEPQYAPYARLIFGNTPEMMEFFSGRLGVDYPWPKYAQVVVRDFVSGAMENTSATTHFERLQHDARQHLDHTYEDIVSHELFHQWFGDLVTCESWAHLSLNEGFATYGEYLWIEYKYGLEEATLHLLGDRGAYLRSARHQPLPIIRYHHRDADAMFDAHSYQKGGQVLHMLRKQVGDAAFFAALQRYLTQNAYDDVEIHELRLAFEEVTGEDLNWFFDQWYLSPGHPVLDVTHGYAHGKYSLHIQQVQPTSALPVFRLPLTVGFCQGGKVQEILVWMETADTTFTFEVPQQPDFVMVDPRQDLLMEMAHVQQPHTNAWLSQAVQAPGFGAKMAALQGMDVSLLPDSALQELLGLSQDGFWGLRNALLDVLDAKGMGARPGVMEVCLEGLGDPNAHVRVTAVMFLNSNLNHLPPSLHSVARQALLSGIQDSSYAMSQLSLETYCSLEPATGLAKVKEMMAQPEPHLVGTIAKVLKEHGSPEALPFIQEHLQDPSVENGTKISLLRGLGEYLSQRSTTEKATGTRLLMSLAKSSHNRWLRITALQALEVMEPTEEIRVLFQSLRLTTEDPMVRSVAERYMSSH